VVGKGAVGEAAVVEAAAAAATTVQVVVATEWVTEEVKEATEEV